MSGDVLCRYSAFSPYLALSHSISAHQTKTMLFICNNGDCDYQCVAEVDMVQHMRVEHSDYGSAIPLVCTSTLVVKKSSGDGFVECPVLVKRTGAVEFVTSCRVKSKSLPARTTVTAKRSVRHVSVSSSDDDAGESDEEVPPKRHNLRQKAGAKGTKTQKAGGRETGVRVAKQAGKAKATKRKRARIDVESEEELQNTTVTSTNDRTSVTTTAAAAAMTEESNDDPTQNMETDNDNDDGRRNVKTAAEQAEDDTEDEATDVSDQAEQMQEDKTEDDQSNVMAGSELEEEAGNNADVITTTEQTKDIAEEETGNGETETGSNSDRSAQSAAVATAPAGELVANEHVEAAADDTDNRDIDTDTANDQVSAVSTAVVSETETGDRGVESDGMQSADNMQTDRPNVMTASEQDEETGDDSSVIATTEQTAKDGAEDETRNSEVETKISSDHSAQSTAAATAGELLATEHVEAADDDTDNRQIDTNTANEQVSAVSTAVMSETQTGDRGVEFDEMLSADDGIDAEHTCQTSAAAAVDSPSGSATATAPAAVNETEKLPVAAETAE